MPEKVEIGRQKEQDNQDNTQANTERTMARVLPQGEPKPVPVQHDKSHVANNTAAATVTATSTVTVVPQRVPSKVIINDSLAAIKRKQKVLEMKKFTGAPSAGLDPEAGFVIPENFALVWPGVYRSSFPKEDSFEFLKCLKIKSILTLFPEEYPAVNTTFMKEAGIEHFQIGMPGNKEPFVNIPKDRVAAALRVVLDRKNHPILIHCNKGKHRTGCVVGCLRKIQKWGLTLIFDEYRRHSHPKSRALDQQFIELFDQSVVMNVAIENDWVPKHSL